MVSRETSNARKVIPKSQFRKSCKDLKSKSTFNLFGLGNPTIEFIIICLFLDITQYLLPDSLSFKTTVN